MTPNGETDLREKFTPLVIFVGKYFFNLLDGQTNPDGTTRDIEFRSTVLLHETVHYQFFWKMT